MATKVWSGNAQAVAQIQTYAPGPQLPNTTITATINGKTASYTSTTGSNDDLVAGIVAAWAGVVTTAPEFAEVSATKVNYSPAVPAPNATYLKLQSKVAGVPFTVTITLTQPAKATVTRITAGKAGVNEKQQLKISPNAESGSSFTLAWGGNTTNAIPTPASAPTSATGAAGVLTGAYQWLVTFGTAKGETEAGLPSASLTLAAQQGSLTAIPLGPSNCTFRNIYRTKAGGTVFYFVHQIADNSTTTYTDNSTDATIGVNPSPPATNGCLHGELEALAGIGQGNIKVGGANTAAYAGMVMPSSAIIYTAEFTGSLGSASQALIAGNVNSVTILPPVTLAVTRVGCPPQNEIQTIGWKQVIGTVAPAGTFAVTLPGLSVTTAPIAYNASAATVLAALVAAAGPAYSAAFAVSLTQQTAAGYLWQVTYQGTLGNQAVPLATVDVTKLVAAAGDTATGYQAETQAGSTTGRNSVITATLGNSPTGGTFGVTGTLANGNTISATGVAYNATAATLAAAFPANTVSVTGSAGGPYTIEAIGEAASQAVTWTATSSLTGGGNTAGSPPGSNTTALSAPSNLQVGNSNTLGYEETFGNNTHYYYVVTATNSSGETTKSNEVFGDVSPNASGAAKLTWNAVAGATGYNIYRGSTPGSESVKVAAIPALANPYYDDYQQTNTANSAPANNSGLTGIFATVYNPSSNIGTGMLSPGTYYYLVSDGTNTAEVSATITTLGQVVVITSGLTFTSNSAQIWRGTSSGAENVLLGTVSNLNTLGSLLQIADTGATNASASPPGSNTTAISAPVQSNTSTSASGGNLAAATYYYEVTATNSSGETTASNEKSQVTTGSTSTVTVSWAAVTGANGYKIYRGTSASGENLLVGQVFSQSTTSFIDVGTVPATFTPTELVAGAAAINEVQQITLTGASGGTFQLGFEGVETIALSYAESAADMQTQLQALSTVGAGGFTVSGANGGPFTVTAAGPLAGMPLPYIAANSTALVGSSTTTAALTTVQNATGPSWWNNANNWSPTGVPANGDTVYFQNNTVDCTDGLAQSAVTLAALFIDLSYVGGQIGRPAWNGKYYEYRQQYLQIGCSGTITIGNGKGSGPTLFKLDTGTVATKFLINGTGNSTDPTVPVVQWKGARSAGTTEIDIYKGSFGAALFAGETATIDTIRQGYVTNVNSDSTVIVGQGVTFNTEWYMMGGVGTLYTSCPLIHQENGTLTLFDGLTATAVTTLNVVGGTVNDRSTGTIATLTVATGAKYDRSDDSRPKTVTNTTIYGKSSFLDPNGSITFTNPYVLSNCGYPDLIAFDVGTNVTGQRVQL